MFKAMVSEMKIEMSIMFNTVIDMFKNGQYLKGIGYSSLLLLDVLLIPVEMLVWFVKNC